MQSNRRYTVCVNDIMEEKFHTWLAADKEAADDTSSTELPRTGTDAGWITRRDKLGDVQAVVTGTNEDPELFQAYLCNSFPSITTRIGLHQR